jgi:hypothetical protein
MAVLEETIRTYLHNLLANQAFLLAVVAAGLTPHGQGMTTVDSEALVAVELVV